MTIQLTQSQKIATDEVRKMAKLHREQSELHANLANDYDLMAAMSENAFIAMNSATAQPEDPLLNINTVIPPKPENPEDTKKVKAAVKAGKTKKVKRGFAEGGEPQKNVKQKS